MSRPLTVELFAEDRGHEALLVPLIERIGRELGVAVHVNVRCARGGHGRALQEYRNYQTLLTAGWVGQDAADLLVVAIDGNCSTFRRMRREIQDATREVLRGRVVAACPDPHVERWYLADPQSFAQVVGPPPPLGKRKCQRDHYKQVLSRAIREAGHPPTLGGVEFAKELAEEMDLYRASKNDRSLGAFLDDLRGKLTVLHGG